MSTRWLAFLPFATASAWAQQPAADPAPAEPAALGADESTMPFLDADAAFARAAATGRRVLVYQDWPT